MEDGKKNTVLEMLNKKCKDLFALIIHESSDFVPLRVEGKARI